MDEKDEKVISGSVRPKEVPETSKCEVPLKIKKKPGRKRKPSEPSARFVKGPVCLEFGIGFGNAF